MLRRSEPREAGTWTVDASTGEFPLLADHRLRGVLVLPGAAVVEMALAAAAATGRPSPSLEDLRLERVCVLAASGSRRIRVTLHEASDAGRTVTVTSGAGYAKTTHATVRIAGHADPSAPVDVTERTRTVRDSGAEVLVDDFYRGLASVGNDYGPAFRTLRRVWRGDGAAYAHLHAEAAHLTRLLLLDAAVQLVAAATGAHDWPFLWAGCARLRISDALAVGGEPAGVRGYARLRSATGTDEVTGDAVLLDSTGRVVAELTGVRLHWARAGRTSRTLALAATFDAGAQIADLGNQMAALGAPVRVVHERVDSLVGLTAPGGLLASNRDGVNVLLVRPDDVRDAPARESGAQFTVPGVGDIAHLHGYETEYLYDEIFVQEAYLRHGITLRPGDTVFDIGANIGMFTLFVQHRFPGTRVFAFEPALPPFEVLRENVARHCPNSQAFNYGISDEDGGKPFTFYRNSTAFSGFAADPERDARTIRTVIENVLHTRIPAGTLDMRPIVARLLRDRLVADVHPCHTRTLSTVLRETGVDQVDLLKIDTEGSEIEVLRGVEEEDWAGIRQVVLEVHGRDDQRQVITSLLADRGFDVLVDRQEHLLRGTDLTTVVARRPGDRPGRTGEATGGTAVARPFARRAARFARAVADLRRSTLAPCIVCLCPSPGGGPHDEELVSALTSVLDVVVVTDTAALAATAARVLRDRPPIPAVNPAD
ncbi:FkbM family methyltransferase [Actinomycetes bacterium KLBMP 9797]